MGSYQLNLRRACLTSFKPSKANRVLLRIERGRRIGGPEVKEMEGSANR